MRPLTKVLVYAVLGSWSLVCLLPIYWVAVTSIKSGRDIDRPPGYLPFVDFSPTLDAWRFILLDLHENLVTRLVNSAVIGVSATGLTLAVSGLAIYGLTRFRRAESPRGAVFPATAALFAIMATRVLPTVVIALPLYSLAASTGLRDTRTLMILVYASVNIPVAVWLLLPIIGLKATEQEESALIDGASHAVIFVSILVPMVRAGIVAVGLIIFLLCWNEYILAAYLTADDALTLPPWAVGQLSMKEAQVGGGAEEWAHLSASIVVMIAPVLLLTSLALRHLATPGIGRPR